MFREQLRESSETMFGVLFSGSFMLLWLCCWPFYRLAPGETWKNPASLRMWVLLSSRLPFRTREAMERAPRMGVRSAGRKPRCSSRKWIMPMGSTGGNG
jgi:hypothetical protein